MFFRGDFIFTIFSLLVVVLLIGLSLAEYKAENNKRIKNAHAYISRLAFGFIYFVVGIGLIIFFKDQIFYLDERNELLFDSRYKLMNDGPRFIWCGACSLIGFGFAAFESRFSQSLPYLKYVFFYPVPLLLITSLGYSLLSLNLITRGHIFYTLSFVFCVTLAVSVDRYWKFAESIFQAKQLKGQ